MKKLGSRGKKQFDDQIGNSKYVMDTDKLDVRFFQDVLENNPKIAKMIDEAQAGYEQFPELQQDIFSSLYRYKPHLLKEHQVNGDYLLNHHVMNGMVESPKYKELRALTRQDIINSTLGTEVLGDEAHQLIKKLQKEAEKLMDEIKKAQQAVGNAQGDQEGEGEGGAPGNGTKPGDEEGEGPEQLTLKEAQDKLAEAKKNLKNHVKKKETQSQMNRMMDKVHQTVTETSDMITSWGLDGDDTFTKMPYHEKMELLKRLRNSSKLKRIAQLAGRFKNLAANSQREKVKIGMDEIYDIEQGNNIGKLIPTELMKLRHSATRLLFYKDYAEGKLLQYKLRGKEKKQKGAIIVCIDDSGSMSGEPEIWSKAVAMALLEVAIYQKRDFYCIHFDHTRDPKKLHINEFPKGAPYNIMEVLDMAEYFSGGGTVFEPALDLSRAKISEMDVYKKADIIFITDGEAPVGDEWAKDFCKWRDANNVSVYGILIDAYYNTTVAMDLFCTSIHKLSAINKDTSEELAITLFDSV